MSEADNHQRWNGHPGHYEVWYVTLSDRVTGTGFWIRTTMEAPKAGHGSPHAEQWFAFFDAADPRRNFALRRRAPIAALVETRAPWALRFGDVRLAQGAAAGSIDGAAHAASWDLAWTPGERTFHHLPDGLYESRVAQTKVLSPSLCARFSGRIVADGRAIDLAAQPGCQTHLWGVKHAHAWAWAHCNAFREDEGAVVEAVTARLKRGAVVLPPITVLYVRAGGEEHHLRAPWRLPLSHGRWETGLYRCGAVSARAKIECEFRCRPEDLVRADYSDPDGEASFCHNSEVADARLVLWRRRGLGWREIARLTAPRAGHFEYAGRSRDPHVARAYERV